MRCSRCATGLGSCLRIPSITTGSVRQLHLPLRLHVAPELAAPGTPNKNFFHVAEWCCAGAVLAGIVTLIPLFLAQCVVKY